MQTLLVLEKNPRNMSLMIGFLEQLGYKVVPVTELKDISAALDQETKVQLALLDIAGYDASIWTWCEKMRVQGIHLLVISQKQSLELTNESMKHGVSSVLVKPLVMKELSGLIVNLLQSEDLS